MFGLECDQFKEDVVPYKTALIKVIGYCVMIQFNVLARIFNYVQSNVVIVEDLVIRCFSACLYTSNELGINITSHDFIKKSLCHIHVLMLFFSAQAQW